MVVTWGVLKDGAVGWCFVGVDHNPNKLNEGDIKMVVLGNGI